MVVFTACAEETSTRTYEDEGITCVKEDTNVTSGALVVVAVVPCASYCATVKHVECSVEREERTLTVTSSAAIEVPTEGSCAGACQPVVAECEVPGGELELGDYEIIHGDNTETVTLPSGDSCDEWEGPHDA